MYMPTGLSLFPAYKKMRFCVSAALALFCMREQIYIRVVGQRMRINRFLPQPKSAVLETEVAAGQLVKLNSRRRICGGKRAVSENRATSHFIIWPLAC
jgi:hypothetical protein